MYRWLLIIFVVFSFELLAQDKKQVEILNADRLQFQTLEDGTSVRKLVGDVQLKQEETFMYCDSAYLYKEENVLEAYGNVHIQEKDSVDVYSDRLDYDGNDRKAVLSGNARMTDGELKLTADVLFYDLQTKIGSYDSSGVITTDSTVLTSDIGYYYANTGMAHFNRNVVITDPDYNLISDTLQYDTDEEVAYFYGPTTIYNDSSRIECLRGTYRTNEEIATFGYRTYIYNGDQTLYSDSLYYERFRGYGKAMKYFVWQDSEMKAMMKGSNAEYFEDNDRIVAYNRPVMAVELEEDTLFLSGTTVYAQENTELDAKEFWAYPRVRMFKSDLQGVADSMYYSFADSLMEMYRDPILWNERTEMRGDTVYAQFAEERIKTVDFKRNAMIASNSAAQLYDQVSSTFITGYFSEEELRSMNARGNALSLYFGKNDDDEYLGANYVESAEMWIYLQDAEVAKIRFEQSPEAVFTPMQMLGNDKRFLQGFQWNDEIRPKDKSDL